MLARTRWLPTPGPLELQRYKMDYFVSAKVWHFYRGPWIICSYLGPGVMGASNISLHVLLDRRSLLNTQLMKTDHHAFRVQTHAINHNPCIHGHDTPKWSVHTDAMHAYITHTSECMRIMCFLPLKYVLTSLCVHDAIDVRAHMCSYSSVTCISVHVAISPVGLAGYGLAAGEVAEQT